MLEVGLSGFLLDSPHSGTAAYSRNLAAALPPAAPEFAYNLFVHRAAGLNLGMPETQLRTPISRWNQGRSAGARLDKLYWETVALPIAAIRRGEALLHSLYFAAPPYSAAPVVVTIHDLIPLAVPGYHRSRWAQVYSRFMAWTAHRAAAIITVSEHARRDVLRLLRVPEDKVTVTPEAADPACSTVSAPDERERICRRYRLPERYILYLGGAERRKNLETLVRAWARARRAMEREETTLVIVAHFPPADRLYPDIPALASSLGVHDGIHFVDAIDERDKAALYRGALAFCFPSWYEGFGLTPLEAMACGAPVIAASATSIPEVVGDAGTLVPPHDVEAWADAITELVSSPQLRTALRERGLKRAESFSWERTARQTATVYHQVLQT